MPLWDITAPLSPETPVYPGDEPVRFWKTASIDRGDASNVSAFSMSVHAGTHVDAPSHLGFEGDADSIPLEVLTGACVVLDLSRAPECGGAPEAPFLIRLEDAGAELQRATAKGPVVRLLLKTGRRPATGLDPELVRMLCERGVRLIGLELSSIDPETGPEAEMLPAHRAALAAGTIVLENLVLDGVPEGHYNLWALPTALAGLEAAPVRAVLHGPLVTEHEAAELTDSNESILSLKS